MIEKKQQIIHVHAYIYVTRRGRMCPVEVLTGVAPDHLVHSLSVISSYNVYYKHYYDNECPNYEQRTL